MYSTILKSSNFRLSLFLLLLSQSVYADVYTVTKTQDTNDGICDDDCSFREAIIASNNHTGHDTITLPSGTYRQTISGKNEVDSAKGSWDVKDDLTINGSGRDSTIIDGSGDDLVLYLDPFSDNITITITALTVQGGDSVYGGGISNNATLTLEDVRVSDNTANNGGGLLNTGVLTLQNTFFINNHAVSDGETSKGFGGAIYDEGPSTTIVDSKFEDNDADHNGAGIYASNSEEASIADTIFRNNISEGYGGGIAINTSVTLQNCTFESNEANDGGAVSSHPSSSVNIQSSTFTANRATGIDEGGGGALFNYQGNLLIQNSSFENNYAYGEGGGAIESRGNFTITASNFLNNEAKMHDGSQLPGNTNPGFGGAILLIEGSNTSISTCTLSNNTAGNNGGAIYNDFDTTLTVKDSTLSSNTATNKYGGAIYNEGDLNIDHSVFTENSTALLGGALATRTGTATVSKSQFTGNSSAENGGAIYVSLNSPLFTLTSSELKQNSAENLGGAIYNESEIKISKSTISDNSAHSGGGIGNFMSSTLTIDQSTISGNEAATFGGGIINSTSNINISNSTIVGNSASNGGGISNNDDNAEVTLSSVTMADNSATYSDKEFLNYQGRFTILNTLISGSCNNNNGDIISQGGNVEYPSNTCGFTHTTDLSNASDLFLGSLQNNGGKTKTIAIGEGSPAINHGNQSACSNTDQRNFERAGECDSGAYETDGIPAEDSSAFIERFYVNILGRASDEGGMAYWLDQLQQTSAAFVALGFFNSDEYKELSLEDDSFIELLYSTMYGREPDTGGFNYWVEQLGNDVTREGVIFSFINAQEFKDLCESYDVASMPTGVEGFVMRFYSLVLGRVDKSGLDYWSTQISTGEITPEESASNFFASTEYQDMNQNNPTFINTAYQAFFGRMADQGGKDYWNDEMESGVIRAEVVRRFSISDEFQDIIQSFGL